MSEATTEILLRNILMSEREEDRRGGLDIDSPAVGVYSAGLRYRGLPQYGSSIHAALENLAAARIVERAREEKERAKDVPAVIASGGSS